MNLMLALCCSVEINSAKERSLVKSVVMIGHGKIKRLIFFGFKYLSTFTL